MLRAQVAGKAPETGGRMTDAVQVAPDEDPTAVVEVGADAAVEPTAKRRTTRKPKADEAVDSDGRCGRRLGRQARREAPDDSHLDQHCRGTGGRCRPARPPRRRSAGRRARPPRRPTPRPRPRPTAPMRRMPTPRPSRHRSGVRRARPRRPSPPEPTGGRRSDPGSPGRPRGGRDDDPGPRAPRCPARRAGRRRQDDAGAGSGGGPAVTAD